MGRGAGGGGREGNLESDRFATLDGIVKDGAVSQVSDVVDDHEVTWACSQGKLRKRPCTHPNITSSLSQEHARGREHAHGRPTMGPYRRPTSSRCRTGPPR